MITIDGYDVETGHSFRYVSSAVPNRGDIISRRTKSGLKKWAVLSVEWLIKDKVTTLDYKLDIVTIQIKAL